jgi:glycosyltransferase involved in cell wall biosynthesis
VGLVIVGDGPEKAALEKYVMENGLSAHVAFEPMSNALPSYFKTAHCFIVTALHEEFDEIVAKAAASGCAILTSNVGSAKVVVEDGVSGFLCDPSDPASYSRKLVELIRHPEIRDGLKLNGMVMMDRHMTTSAQEYLQHFVDSCQVAIKESGYTP